MERTLRLIVDPPRRATLNMAIDEALLAAQSSAASDPTLRVYFWAAPAITVGYFQDIEKIAKRFPVLPIVRRLTGGGMVLHDDDLTFSLTLKNPNAFLPASAKDSYLRVSEALCAGLKNAHPAMDYADCRHAVSPRGKAERVCFEQPVCHDLLLDGRKVIGSSQRRQRKGMLHQSSVFLDTAGLTESLVRGFEREWGVEFEKSALTQPELETAFAIERSRYGSTEWARTPTQ